MRKSSQMKLTSTPNKRNSPVKSVTSAAREEIGSKPVVSPASLINLKLQLEEAWARENALNKNIVAIVEREAKNIAEHLESMKRLEERLRPEIEKWVMRCEELEQRLGDTMANTGKLGRVMKDCMKTIAIKDK